MICIYETAPTVWFGPRRWQNSKGFRVQGFGPWASSEFMWSSVCRGTCIAGYYIRVTDPAWIMSKRSDWQSLNLICVVRSPN